MSRRKKTGSGTVAAAAGGKGAIGGHINRVVELQRTSFPHHVPHDVAVQAESIKTRVENACGSSALNYNIMTAFELCFQIEITLVQHDSPPTTRIRL